MTDSQDQIQINLKTAPDNLVQPFQVETLELRGRFVRLGSTLNDIIKRHNYPYPAAKLLAEALTLTACLANAMKYEGVFTIQAMGDGPIPLLVSDITNTGAIRGYVNINEEKLKELYGNLDKVDKDVNLAIPHLMGQGHLAFTMNSKLHKDRYQGIVELTGESLTDCVHHYFHQSEQIETVIKVAADQVKEENGKLVWRSCAIMLQRLPAEEKDKFSQSELKQMEEDWNRALVFLGSSTADEMLSPTLAPSHLMYRLFNEDGVRVFEPLPIQDKCQCDKKRMENVLKSMTEEELEEAMVDGVVTVTCQFCSKTREYTRKKLDKLRVKKS